jgi:hypothetical protein
MGAWSCGFLDQRMWPTSIEERDNLLDDVIPNDMIDGIHITQVGRIARLRPNKYNITVNLSILG